MTAAAQITNLTKDSLAWGCSDSEKGEVFTNPDIVKFMLKTCGITDSILQENTTVLEPSCGQGEFVLEIARILVDRLSRTSNSNIIRAECFSNLVSAYDISSKNIQIAKNNTASVLSTFFSSEDAKMLVNAWYRNEDFLLSITPNSFSHVIGNPPYVRIENIPKNLLIAYRSCFSTMKERADLYVAFYEKSLKQLRLRGTLSFICTDRWTKNSYGSKLRSLIASEFQLDLYVDLYGQNAFQSEVLTYPAITQISRQKHKQTIIIHNPEVNEHFSEQVTNTLKNPHFNLPGKILRKDVVKGAAPWMFGSQDELDLINRLESSHPLIEDAGCKVYIGAATGSNKAYIIGTNIDIEPSRKIPLVKAANIKNGEIVNAREFIINTYDKDGVIDLNSFPKLNRHLSSFEDQLKARHIAKKSPEGWYKTIDRVYPERAASEKLLIPDIKSQLTVAYDSGTYHPNNSIYYMCSGTWNLRALQAVLMSGIGQLFVQAYSTKVSGGNLRFQAQHLRRIRIPFWNNIDEQLQLELEQAAISGDITRAKHLTCTLYELTDKEKQIIGC